MIAVKCLSASSAPCPEFFPWVNSDELVKSQNPGFPLHSGEPRIESGAGAGIHLFQHVLVSALLFTGELSKIVVLWQRGKEVPLVSRETFEELRAVLEYPKFSLAPDEIQGIIEDKILPCFEVVEVKENVRGGCRDPADDKFLACAPGGSAHFILSGNKDLTDSKSYRTIRTISKRLKSLRIRADTSLIWPDRPEKVVVLPMAVGLLAKCCRV